MSENYFVFVFHITADSMHLSLVYLVDVSVTIFLFIFLLTHSTVAFCEHTIHLMIREKITSTDETCRRKYVTENQSL